MTHLHVFDTVHQAAGFFGERWPRVSIGADSDRFITVRMDPIAIAGLELSGATIHTRKIPPELRQQIEWRLAMGQRVARRETA